MLVNDRNAVAGVLCAQTKRHGRSRRRAAKWTMNKSAKEGHKNTRRVQSEVRPGANTHLAYNRCSPTSYRCARLPQCLSWAGAHSFCSSPCLPHFDTTQHQYSKDFLALLFTHFYSAAARSKEITVSAWVLYGPLKYSWRAIVGSWGCGGRIGCCSVMNR